MRSAVLRASFLIALFSLFSRVLGLYRTRLLAALFGAGPELDAFWAAFRIPDFIYSIVTVGAITAAIIPVFSQYTAKGKLQLGWKYINNVLTTLLLGVAILSLVTLLLAPYLVELLFPRFGAEQRELTTALLRLLLLSPLMFTISGIMGATLNGLHRFFLYALAPIFYNLGIIFGLKVFTGIFDLGIYGAVYGVLLGAFLQMVLQAAGIWRLGFRFRPIVELKDKALRETLRLMGPRTLSLGILQINLIVVTVVGGMLRPGSISIFNLASDLQILPVALIGISYATAMFPLLARYITDEDLGGFRRFFSQAVSRTLFLIIPAAAGLFLLRAQVVRLSVGAGQFTWDDTRYLVSTLAFFILSLPAQALLPLYTRAFFALKDTRTTLVSNSLSVVLNIFLSWLFCLSPWFDLGVVGLALAFSCANILDFLILHLQLRRKLGNLGERRLLRPLAKYLTATLAMGIVVYFALYAVEPFVDTTRVLGLLLQTGVAATLGALTYFAVCTLLRTEELALFVPRLQAYLRRLKLIR